MLLSVYPGLHSHIYLLMHGMVACQALRSTYQRLRRQVCPCSLVRVRLARVRHYPRGSIYTTIMEFGPQNHNGDGLLGANSIIVVYMDPLGIGTNQLPPALMAHKDSKALTQIHPASASCLLKYTAFALIDGKIMM